MAERTRVLISAEVGREPRPGSLRGKIYAHMDAGWTDAEKLLDHLQRQEPWRRITWRYLSNVVREWKRARAATAPEGGS